jgi:hypothetical protein
MMAMWVQDGTARVRTANLQDNYEARGIDI